MTFGFLVAASVIAISDNDAAKAEWLPRLATGEVIAALAVDEGPVHDPAKIATRVSDGKITGDKAFVAEGDAAELFLVAAADGLYCVADGAGVALTKDESREAVYGMPYAEWKARFQTEASPEQQAGFAAAPPKDH